MNSASEESSNQENYTLIPFLVFLTTAPMDSGNHRTMAQT